MVYVEYQPGRPTLYTALKSVPSLSAAAATIGVTSVSGLRCQIIKSEEFPLVRKSCRITSGLPTDRPVMAHTGVVSDLAMFRHRFLTNITTIKNRIASAADRSRLFMTKALGQFPSLASYRNRSPST